MNDDGSSQSGGERNHLFWSQRGEQFVDISALTGLDDRADGRVAAQLDFDQDGWVDLALANANAPFLSLQRNRAGDLDGVSTNNWIALRFEGGNATGEASEWSNRDGIGARVTVLFGDRRLTRELRAGEGLASQNSARMLIGLGDAQGPIAIEVNWPSGKKQHFTGVDTRQTFCVYENPELAPNGEGLDLPRAELRK